MPAARDSLLDAAFAALAHRPWPRIRMVDVARAAGVSRQTLYNEFGSKNGLARALVRRETGAYLRGVDRVLLAPSGAAPGERLVAVAEWTVGQARVNPLVRAAITGCWDAWLPSPDRLDALPRPERFRAPGGAATGIPSPSQLIGEVRDRAVAALGEELGEDLPRSAVTEPATVCEVVVRLALACAVAPVEAREAVRLVRGALPGTPRVTGPNRTAEAR